MSHSNVCWKGLYQAVFELGCVICTYGKLLKVAKKFICAKEFYLDNYLEVIECSNIGKSVQLFFPTHWYWYSYPLN